MTKALAKALDAAGTARKRMLAEQARADHLVEQAAPCSLCKARPGQRCVKGGFADIPGSGPARGPHAERRRAAGAKR
jgi:hypothetical protein